MFGFKRRFECVFTMFGCSLQSSWAMVIAMGSRYPRYWPRTSSEMSISTEHSCEIQIRIVKKMFEALDRDNVVCCLSDASRLPREHY